MKQTVGPGGICIQVKGDLVMDPNPIVTGQPNGVPNVYTPEEIVELAMTNQKEIQPGRWVACRPMGYQSLGFRKRLKAAWMVFTGRWDALKWTGQ